MLSQRINIVPNWALEQHRILHDYSNFGSELVQTELSDVHAVDVYVAAERLQDAQQTQSKRGFTRAGSAHNSNLLSLVYCEGDVFYHAFELGPLFDGKVVKMNDTLFRPAFAGHLVGVRNDFVLAHIIADFEVALVALFGDDLHEGGAALQWYHLVLHLR